ncbi:MAG: hypothetical protein MZV70_68005 [Desulfobacterales bacterium]|nr:hypothetical protein [Desulfobacterales bacterium]
MTERARPIRPAPMLALTLLVACALASSPAASAAPSGQAPGAAERFSFRRLDTGVGLSGDSVYCMLQDELGFLWIGTFSGLSRYDGSRVVVYRPVPGDPESLPSSLIFDIHEDSVGTLWIATDGGGLARYSRDSDAFERFRHDPSSPGSLGSDRTFTVTDDPYGWIWVRTADAGLDRFDSVRGEFRHYRVADGLPSDTVRSLSCDAAGRLWAGTTAGLAMYDRERDAFVAVGSTGRSTVRALFDDGSGTILVGTEGDGVLRPRRRLGRGRARRARPRLGQAPRQGLRQGHRRPALGRHRGQGHQDTRSVERRRGDPAGLRRTAGRPGPRRGPGTPRGQVRPRMGRHPRRRRGGIQPAFPRGDADRPGRTARRGAPIPGGNRKCGTCSNRATARSGWPPTAGASCVRIQKGSSSPSTGTTRVIRRAFPATAPSAWPRSRAAPCGSAPMGRGWPASIPGQAGSRVSGGTRPTRGRSAATPYGRCSSTGRARCGWASRAAASTASSLETAASGTIPRCRATHRRSAASRCGPCSKTPADASGSASGTAG